MFPNHELIFECVSGEYQEGRKGRKELLTMEMLNLPEQKNPTGEQQMEELLRKQQVDIMFHPATTVFEPANEIFEPASTVFEPASDIFEPVNSEYGFQY